MLHQGLTGANASLAGEHGYRKDPAGVTLLLWGTKHITNQLIIDEGAHQTGWPGIDGLAEKEIRVAMVAKTGLLNAMGKPPVAGIKGFDLQNVIHR